VLPRTSSEHETVSKKGTDFGGFCTPLSGPAQNGPLDHTQVTDQFASRLPPFDWPRFPLVLRNGICGEQKFALRSQKVLDDGRK